MPRFLGGFPGAAIRERRYLRLPFSAVNGPVKSDEER
jgi:hypothetical protein